MDLPHDQPRDAPGGRVDGRVDGRMPGRMPGRTHGRMYDWMYDSHVHLSDPEFAPVIGGMLRYMSRTRVMSCCVSTDAASSARTLALARSSPLVIPFVGVHPDSAAEGPDGALEIAADPLVAGIGEVGLDPAYPRDGQLATFRAMLEAAARLDVPVSVHSRNSLDEVLDVAASYGVRVLLHWFDGSRRQLARAMELGMYVSYGPASVRAAGRMSTARRADPGLILAETDGPVRFRGCFGGRPGGPHLVPSVIAGLAGALGRGFADAAALLGRNTRRYLGARYNTPPPATPRSEQDPPALGRGA
ncbi:MAG: TatD family hydrolase [Nitrosopumilus sp.]|nr:TatD family hydrolase [Nitrosopumilus sp.]